MRDKENLTYAQNGFYSATEQNKIMSFVGK
jgi:hypothetical protein